MNTVIFVRNEKSYNYFSFDGDEFTGLMKKDSKDYNYETDKTFQYRTDAVFDGYWEKGGVSYIWKKENLRHLQLAIKYV